VFSKVTLLQSFVGKQDPSRPSRGVGLVQVVLLPMFNIVSGQAKMQNLSYTLFGRSETRDAWRAFRDIYLILA
jgi:hypothetical protein